MFPCVINFTKFNFLSSESVCKKLLSLEIFHKDLRKTDNKLLTVCLYVPGLKKQTKPNKKQKSLEPNQTSLSPESGAELDCTKCQERTHRISHGRHGRLSTGTYREYGKEKKGPHRAGHEELPRIN